MLDHFYHGAFDARVETKNVIVGEGIAVLEADFVGRHIGEFAGVSPTGKDVRVPLAVIYELRDGRIVEGRIYFETPASWPRSALSARSRRSAVLTERIWACPPPARSRGGHRAP